MNGIKHIYLFLLIFNIIYINTQPAWCNLASTVQKTTGYTMCNAVTNTDPIQSASSWCSGRNFASSSKITFKDKYNQCDSTDAVCVPQPVNPLLQSVLIIFKL
jgi:hypothetical protein